MIQLFGIPIDTLTTILLITTLVIVGVVLVLALGNLLFFKIGVRNIPRRRTQMWLIVFALMLSTTLLSSVLATGDVITAAVQSVAVYNLGSVDETITGGYGGLGFFPDRVYQELVNLAQYDHDIAAVGAALVEQNLLVADITSRQVRSKVVALAIIPGSEKGFGGMQDDQSHKLLTIAALGDNEVYLNHTTAILLNADLSDRVANQLGRRIPGNERITEIKQIGVQNSQKAEDIFSRIFALFCLFALAIGLLLIFLIFILLAAERRVEMGMARAIGVQRRHLILMFLFEGSVYDLLASFIGLGIGIGVGTLLVFFLGPTLARFNFPLKLTFQPHSLILAYCLGVIFTFCSVAISAWIVSRMTVVDAIRNLPESGRQSLSLREIGTLLLNVGAQFVVPNHQFIASKKAYKQLPD